MVCQKLCQELCVFFRVGITTEEVVIIFASESPGDFYHRESAIWHQHGSIIGCICHYSQWVLRQKDEDSQMVPSGELT